MLNVILIEDEVADKTLIEEFLIRFTNEREMTYSLEWFTSPVDFLSKYRKGADLILLDIELPDMDGMRCAKRLRELDSEVPLIFVTNMAQYAIKGYEVSAVDFIVKPVHYYDFAMKLERIIKKQQQSNAPKITLRMDGGLVKYLSLNEIYYVEVSGHNIVYHTCDGDFETYGSLKQEEPLLLQNYFFRPISYCLVNLRYVVAVNNNTITLSLGGGNRTEEVGISRKRKKDFINALNVYLMENL